jgi:hypothetical protein
VCKFFNILVNAFLPASPLLSGTFLKTMPGVFSNKSALGAVGVLLMANVSQCQYIPSLNHTSQPTSSYHHYKTSVLFAVNFYY